MREALVSIGSDEWAALGIDELVDLFRTAGIRDFDELACHGDRSIVQAAVDEPVDEDRLDTLEYVEEWERVSDSADSTVYVVSFSVPEASDGLGDLVDDLVGTCDPTVTDHGATMSLVGDQPTIARAISEYENEGVSTRLERLGEYAGPEEPLDRLTDRQREVIQTAFDEGYYDVPRTASTDQIAAHFDVDSSTVAEHLQRAERNLLSYHLDAE